MSTSMEKRFLIFKMPVAFMEGRARIMLLAATADQAALAAADPGITPAWLAQFQSEITLAEEEATPLVARAELRAATAALVPVMEQARTGLQELFFFVGKAWPKSDARMAAFGRSEYTKSDKICMRMALLLEKALAQAAEDAAALNAVGYTAAKTAALAAIMADLQQKMVEQDTQKGAARLVTETYYERHNALWEKMGYLQRLSLIAFSDYGNQQRYRLYQGYRPTKKKPKPSPEIPIEDAVTGVEGVAAGLLEHTEGATPPAH